jgi:hypothetical protein
LRITACSSRSAAPPETVPAAADTQGAERRSGSIDLHRGEVAQLFDSLDPCPFYERDLDADAEEYIVASTRELPQPPRVIVVYLDRSSGEAEDDEASPFNEALLGEITHEGVLPSELSCAGPPLKNA